jgi:hypothetical protein
VLDRGLACRVVGSAMKRQLRTGPTDGRRDKSTAVGRGACGWLDWILLSAPAHSLPALSSETTMISMLTAPSPVLTLRGPVFDRLAAIAFV